jgi:hypothetical protein
MDVGTTENVFFVEYQIKGRMKSQIKCVDEIDPAEVRVVGNEKKVRRAGWYLYTVWLLRYALNAMQWVVL